MEVDMGTGTLLRKRVFLSRFILRRAVFLMWQVSTHPALVRVRCDAPPPVRGKQRAHGRALFVFAVSMPIKNNPP